jgi:hypothetical protein
MSPVFPRASALPAALAALALAALPGAAWATTLQAGPDAPLWARFGAAALLALHIGGGAVGMVSGAMAIASPKGGRVHRMAGKVFFAAMFIAYLIGAGVAPFLSDGQRPNFVAGVLALYLLTSGWWTVKRRDPTPGAADYAGLALTLVIVGLGLYFMRLGAMSPTHSIDGSPPQAFILFTIGGGAAAIGELNFILRRKLSGPARLSRHLWRMCLSWFLASGSFFLGQQKFLPAGFRDSSGPLLLAFAPLIAMVIWLVLVRLPKRRRAQAA